MPPSQVSIYQMIIQQIILKASGNGQFLFAGEQCYLILYLAANPESEKSSQLRSGEIQNL